MPIGCALAPAVVAAAGPAVDACRPAAGSAAGEVAAGVGAAAASPAAAEVAAAAAAISCATSGGTSGCIACSKPCRVKCQQLGLKSAPHGCSTGRANACTAAGTAAGAWHGAAAPMHTMQHSARSATQLGAHATAALPPMHSARSATQLGAHATAVLPHITGRRPQPPRPPTCLYPCTNCCTASRYERARLWYRLARKGLSACVPPLAARAARPRGGGPAAAVCRLYCAMRARQQSWRMQASAAGWQASHASKQLHSTSG